MTSIIRNDFIISRYDTENWVIDLQEQYFIINEQTKKLIEILSVNHDLQEARIIFNKEFDENFQEQEFNVFIESALIETQLLNKGNITWEKRNFIKFQTTLFPSTKAKKLSSPFTFLFTPLLFWTIFSLLFALALNILFIEELHPDGSSLVLVALLYLPTIFLHEIGHIAACRKFTKRNGEIGFGIYFIFPVLYSNISSLWHANKKQKIIGNLAGIYMQLLSMLFFYLGYSLTHYQFLTEISYLIAVYSLIQLIPFVRSDGYWLLADILSIHNLHQKSSIESKNWMKNPFKNRSRKDTFILMYGVFNQLIFGYFIVFQLIYNWKEIMSLPKEILEIVKNVVMLDFAVLSFSTFSISTIVFYILAFNFIQSEISKLIKYFNFKR